MPRRIPCLATDKIYHIYGRSIAKFKILTHPRDIKRFISYLVHCNNSKTKSLSYSIFHLAKFDPIDNDKTLEDCFVQLIAYCIMPTHFHLMLKQIKDNGISMFMRRVLTGYSKYFNTRLKRKGPLWESSFKNVLIETDEQFLHLTRYLHLNPVTAKYINKPENWEFSSYNEYLDAQQQSIKICSYSDYIDMPPNDYKTFVEDNIDYQRSLEEIKHLILE